MPFGTLEVIAGCMSSGKSEELMRRLRRATIAKQEVIVFKPSVDTRTTNQISSRSGGSWDAYVIPTAQDAMDHVGEHHAVIGFDEAQFFDSSILDVVEHLVASGKRVIVAGLDTTYQGKPFGAVPELLAIADQVTKLTAVCLTCGGVATRSYLASKPLQLFPSDQPVVVGGDGMYEARCRECHAKGGE